MYLLFSLFLLWLQGLFGTEVVSLGAGITDYVLPVTEDVLVLEGLTKGGWHPIECDRLATLLERYQGRYTRSPGGSAINVAKVIARLGHKTLAFGRLGSDATADFFTASLQEAGIAPHFVRGPLASGQAVCFITPDGQRTFCTYFGSSQGESPAIDPDAALFEGTRHLHVEGYQLTDPKTLRETIDLAKAAGATVSFDLANRFLVQRYRKEIAEVLPKVDVLLCNSEEAEEYTGLAPREALLALQKVCETVVITLGSQGAIAGRGEIQAFAPPHPAPVVDTNGAGDCFTGAFLSAYLRGKGLQQCVERGCYIASFVIQHHAATLKESQWQKICL